MKEIDFAGSPKLEEVMVGTHMDIQDWISLDSIRSGSFDSNKGLMYETNGTMASSVQRVLPCAEQEWQIGRSTTWPGSPAMKVLQVTRNPFHFDNMRQVSIGSIRNEDNLCINLQLLTCKVKNLELLVLDQVNCSNKVIERGLQPFIKAISPSLKAVLVIYRLDTSWKTGAPWS